MQGKYVTSTTIPSCLWSVRKLKIYSSSQPFTSSAYLSKSQDGNKRFHADFRSQVSENIPFRLLWIGGKKVITISSAGGYKWTRDFFVQGEYETSMTIPSIMLDGLYENFKFILLHSLTFSAYLTRSRDGYERFHADFRCQVYENIPFRLSWIGGKKVKTISLAGG